jgi:hypothetical protein
MRLAFLSGTHVLTWLLFLGLAIWCVVVFPNQPGLFIVAGSLFTLRLLSQWIVLGIAAKKLYKSVGWFAIPFMDFILFIYYVIMSFVLWANRRKKVRWR